MLGYFILVHHFVMQYLCKLGQERENQHAIWHSFRRRQYLEGKARHVRRAATVHHPPRLDRPLMPHAIICEDCGAKRSNAQYKNTRYCHSCRMLRDLVFIAGDTRKCDDCSNAYAPVTRRDRLCGSCNYGSIYTGECKFCGDKHAQLQRAGVAVCVKCVRDPDQRGFIISGLRTGQRTRRAENQAAA